ncbi:TATA box-binding protein-associated factor RNA polymerase I subunit B [Amphiprion ocellaris]|uniref:TATA box-binding protein-associated factor RNA polymerase I subunit B n=1 Tax=Amphiprion ocellaris TaxID=80972 RepID=A0A3Q1BRC5_AMPOC|nr:TATA box-binding protein-associated factor RNA polymerase I subunit B [Amphiprion ocellaris]
MDDEYTAGYREPCSQCSAVDWGITDECHFYCRSCHNVIERTRDVEDTGFVQGGSNKISSIRKGSKKKLERGHIWMVCEGFQFILRNQANALLRLGVSPQFKDDVLCPLWRLFLQRSRLAYTSNPVKSSKFRVQDVNSYSDSAAESSIMSASATDGESNPPSVADSNAENASDYSGSMDVSSYLSARLRRKRSPLSMMKTLALIHLALVWSREALTLSDLLRLVNEGHVPYVNAYEQLPEEMKVVGKDALLFRVESIPSHRVVHKEAQALVLFLQLPAFPPVTCETLLHPELLSLRYLTDTNLPDELHLWVCRLMEQAGMADQTLHTFDPHSCPVLPRYDVQTAALIIVTMKFLFGLDDQTEWNLSNEVGNQSDSGDMFNLRRWYRLMQTALMRAQQRRRQDIARKQWKAKKLIFPKNNGAKRTMMKKKRIAEQVQLCFEKLSSRPAGVQEVSPSSFRFCWGDEEGSDGPSLHHMKLDGVVSQKHNLLTPSNSTYWHPGLKKCDRRRCPSSHYSDMEPTLPRSFVWLLQLFSFLLDVKPSDLYEEVLKVERQVIGTKTHCDVSSRKKKTRTSARTKSSPRTLERTCLTGGESGKTVSDSS